MDPDNFSYPTDHGLNMDPAPASHDNSCTNLDSISIENDDPSFHTGQSSSQPTITLSIGHLRCVNCGINVTQMRRHLLEIEEVRNLIQQWIRPQQVQVSSDNVVCHSCWIAAWNEIRHPTSEQQNAPIVGHGLVCISCGRSLLRIRSHSLCSNSPHEELIRNVIVQQIAPRELPSSSRVCHNCWRRTDRAASHSTVDRETSESSNLPSLQSEIASDELHPEQQSLDTSDSILLPNYVRAPTTQNQCFFPGCNDSHRLTVLSTLRVCLFCEYNYYVPSECRICNYHLYSNSWDLLLGSINNTIKTFSAAQIEDFATLLKDNMHNHLDFDNIQSMPDHEVLL